MEVDPELFFRMTGETPESFGRIVDDLLHAIQSRVQNPRKYRRFRLNARNRMLMTLVWLRQYPIVDVLDTMFNISRAVVSKDIHFILPILRTYLRSEIQ